MKRLMCLLLVLPLLTACTIQIKLSQTVASSEVVQPVEKEPTYTQGVYEISIYETLLYNNSVGNDWQKVYTCDGSILSSGKQWIVPLDTTKTIKIDVTITENDKIPDVGTGSLLVDLVDDFETSAKITVTEDKGGYYGDTAQWQIGCRVELVDKT